MKLFSHPMNSSFSVKGLNACVTTKSKAVPQDDCYPISTKLNCGASYSLRRSWYLISTTRYGLEEWSQSLVTYSQASQSLGHENILPSTGEECHAGTTFDKRAISPMLEVRMTNFSHLDPLKLVRAQRFSSQQATAMDAPETRQRRLIFDLTDPRRRE